MSAKYLFLDTSAYIQVGLLNEDKTWLSYEVIENRRGSQLVHKVIYECLKSNNISFKDIKGIILGNGPGSYTGIRIGEGVAQVLALEGINIFSFYHYEVPGFCGANEYEFFERAFKGEVFQYSKKFEGTSTKLITEEEFNTINFNEGQRYHLTGELLDHKLISIYELFKKFPKEIFNEVITRNKHLPPYYFRPLEKEFRASGVEK